MAERVLRVRADDGVGAATLREGIARIREELGVVAEFPPEVEATAAAAAAAPRLPDLDRTDLPFVTIDPEGAMDLDQALHLERTDDGYRVWYAIADVAAFVAPGDPVDLEAHRRGETLYGADWKVPLHPKALSEDAGSLLPDAVRPALVWRIDLDARGAQTAATVERALVRSRGRYDYAGVQAALDAGTADDVFAVLADIGPLRLALEAERDGVALPLPEQEIDIDGETWRLAFRQQLAVEQWNAQISLLTGMVAATMMLDGGVGLLRTLPPADPRDVERLRRTARALHVEWPADLDYDDFVRTLDPSRPAHAAMVVACTRLLRGAAYVAFEGESPEQFEQAAIGAPYAHVTAPLRRLGDRYAGEICLALCAGEPVPDWVRSALPALPEELRDSARRAGQYESAILSLVEAAVLERRVGEEFEGVIVEVSEKDPTRGKITLPDPAVEAPLTSATDRPLPLGERVVVRLVSADPSSRAVEFRLGDG